MYKIWKKRLRLFVKDSRAFSRSIESKLLKIEELDKLREANNEFLDFEALLESSMYDVVCNLNVFFDSKVRTLR